MANGIDRKKVWEIVWAFVIVVVFIVALVGLATALPDRPEVRWGAIATVLLVFLIAVGLGMTGRPDGILIDWRAKMSLSRLQIVLWTLLVLSAYLTMALPRVMPDGLADVLTAEQVDECAALLKEQGSEKAADVQAWAEQIKELQLQQNKENEINELAKKASQECPRDPLRITFPPELLAALGISTASLAGSSLIKKSKNTKRVKWKVVDEAFKYATETDAESKSAKTEWLNQEGKVSVAREKYDEIKGQFDAEKDPAKKAEIKKKLDPAETALTTATNKSEELKAKYKETESKANKAKEDHDRLRQRKLLQANVSPAQARWADMFRSEEVANYDVVDLGKVQMFFMTIVVVFAYAVAVYGLLTRQGALQNPLGVDFPTFSASLNALLGFSHAGYLVSKIPDSEETES